MKWVSEEFESLFKDHLQALLLKLINDQASSCRSELAVLLGSTVCSRFSIHRQMVEDFGTSSISTTEISNATDSPELLFMISLLLKLAADPAPEVAEQARKVRGFVQTLVRRLFSKYILRFART